ncbi:MAG: hypothetical protein ACODTL_16110 [Brucella sp.]
MVIIDSMFGPWRPDFPDLNNPGLTMARNVTPGAGATASSVTYGAMKRARLYSATSMESRPTGTAVGLDQYGNAKVYGGCASKLYKLAPGDRQWTDMSRTDGYNGVSADRWRSVEYGPYQIFTNFTDAPQYVDMNTDLQFADLTSLVKGRYIGTHKEFVILANTWDPLDSFKTNRIRWSGQGYPSEWAFSAQTQADFQDINGYGPIQGIVCEDNVWVFLKNGIVQMQYIGAPYVYRFDTRVEGKGCSVPESLVTVEGKTFFLSDDGFYMFQNGNLVPIGNGKVNKYFLQKAQSSQFHLMTAMVDPRASLIHWTFVSVDTPNGLPDKTMIYNYQTGEWSEAEATAQFTFNTIALSWTIDRLDEFGTLDDVPASWDDPIWAGGSALLAGMDMTGNVYIYSGDTLPAIFETQELLLINTLRAVDPKAVGDRTNIMGVRPFFEGSQSSASVAVGSRSTSNGVVRWSNPSLPNADTGFAYFRVQDRFHRFRLQLRGEWDKASAIQIDANAAGFR